MTAAIICLNTAALPLARRIQAALPTAEIHGLAKRVAECDQSFDDLGDHLADLFSAARPIIGICAAGILIRKLAPLLDDKHSEPPVLAIASDGSAIVPLLGGHHGANALADRLAEALGGFAAVTTASDSVLGLALDEPPTGWHIANPTAVKDIAARLLSGEPVGLIVETGDAAWLARGNATFETGLSGGIRLTARDGSADCGELIFHPPVLALGIGCERGASFAELRDLTESCLAASSLSRHSVACIVSLDLKADEAAIHELAAYLGVPARFFSAAELLAETPRLQTPSETVFAEVGCYGVAEGAALAAVGSAGELIAPKLKSARATCAIAQSPAVLDTSIIGQKRGRLSIVGMGPGQADWRTPEASAALSAADEIVGYHLYLDLLGDLIADKPRHATELGAETERARIALNRAAAGYHVALVSSGDAGIYGLATLAFELLDTEGSAEWRRVAIEVIPGVSAVQAAASRLGAPLGHDFCTVSLSDLLTPWPTIEARLTAAAQGDFVLALYNPRSERRDWQLPKALEILTTHRPPNTPVALARNLGRDDEAVTVTTLSHVNPAEVDMLTLVLIGSSTTRAFDLGGQAKLYTPRGYAGKATA
jgi:cobalt-precorrin 5A hydrolase/precorrin-3B C17-methyltransferase